MHPLCLDPHQPDGTLGYQNVGHLTRQGFRVGGVSPPLSASSCPRAANDAVGTLRPVLGVYEITVLGFRASHRQPEHFFMSSKSHAAVPTFRRVIGFTRF